MSVKEDLLAVANLLEPEGAWCQGEYAKTSDGKVVWAHDLLACTRCLQGAMYVVSELRPVELINPRYEAMRTAVIDFGSIRNLVLWNDRPERTQEEVVTLVRLTAASIPDTQEIE